MKGLFLGVCRAFIIIKLVSVHCAARNKLMSALNSFSLPRFSYMAIIEGGHRILNDQFTAEALSPETEDDSDEEDMEETDDSDQSESLEEDEDEVILTLANQVEKTEDEDDDEDGLPDISPPPPPLPKRIESLSPASERKFLLQVPQEGDCEIYIWTWGACRPPPPPLRSQLFSTWLQF